MRKGETFTFTDEDRQKFQRLKDIIAKVHMKGFLIALDTNVKDKLFVLYTDWSFSVHSSSSCLLVKLHDKNGTTVLPAVSDSRSLPDSVRSKGSSMCEMAA